MPISICDTSNFSASGCFFELIILPTLSVTLAKSSILISEIFSSSFTSFTLSFLVCSALFLKYYLDKTNSSININNFIKESVDYWNVQIGKLVNKDTIAKLKSNNLINIFRGDYADTASFDLESKIIESGIFNCIIHEKKNFSHGRFINYESLNNNFSIYFKQKSTTKYEIELLKYLENECLLIESKYDGLLAEFDLLIASQFIIYYIGKVLDVDVSKPKYSADAMKIYFYKGDL